MRTTTWITGILAVIIGLMAGSRPCFAIDTPDTGYKITSADQTINVGGVCKNVKSSSLALFAPTKNPGEWNPSFLNWAADNPNKLTLTACATCSDGIQNQGETGIDCGGPCPACPACTLDSQCNDSNPCTNDSCAGGACQHVNNTAPCDDGNPATCNDTCSNGTCAGGTCAACSQDSECTANTNPCKDNRCIGGTCSYPDKANGTTCDDGNPATCNDVCSNGTCAGVTCSSPSCGDGSCNNGEDSSTCCKDCPCPASYFCPSAGLKCCPDGYHWDTSDCCDSGWHKNPSGPGCIPDSYSCGTLLGQAGLPDVGEGCCAIGCASGHQEVGPSNDCTHCCANDGAGACVVAPTCSDGIQNQGETGVDCGGPCAACPECTKNSDCAYLNAPCDEFGCITKGKCFGGVCQESTSCCFSGETSILTPKGLVSIKKLSVGSTILSWDDKKKALVPARVGLLHRRSSKELLRVTFSNGLVLDTTSEHPFYDPRTGDYKFISEFKVGDRVFFLKNHQKKGTMLRIKSFKKISGSFTVYTLSVGGEFKNFFAGGVLVHNKCAPLAQ